MTKKVPLPPIGVPFKRGEYVNITCDGRTVLGMVTMASENGRSLILVFDEMLAGHVGMMPVLQKDDGKFVSLIGNAKVEIVRKPK